MAKQKRISTSADGLTTRTLVTEHTAGTKEHEHRVKVVQETDPIIDRVRHLNDKVNGAPVVGNRNEMTYIGTVPVAILMDWLQKRGKTMDQYARNEDGLADKFKRWFLHNRDLSKFQAKSYAHNPGRVFGG